MTAQQRPISSTPFLFRAVQHPAHVLLSSLPEEHGRLCVREPSLRRRIGSGNVPANPDAQSLLFTRSQLVQRTPGCWSRPSLVKTSEPKWDQWAIGEAW